MATTVVDCGINNYKGNFWDVALNRTANMKTAKTGLLVVDGPLYQSKKAQDKIAELINFYKGKGVNYTLNVGLLSYQYLKSKSTSYDYIYIIGKKYTISGNESDHVKSGKIAEHFGLTKKSFNVPSPFSLSNAWTNFSNFFKKLVGKSSAAGWAKSDFADVATEQDLRRGATGKMVGISIYKDEADMVDAITRELSMYGNVGTSTITFTGRPFDKKAETAKTNAWELAKSETKGRFGVAPSDNVGEVPANFKGIVGHTGHGSNGYIYFETKTDEDGCGYSIRLDDFEKTVIISNGCCVTELFGGTSALGFFGNTRYGATFGGNYNGFATKEFYTKIKAGWSLGQAALSACCQGNDYYDCEMTLIGNPAFRIV